MSEDTVYEDLTVAMLAVNAYPVEKVFPMRDGLRKQGFFDPATVSKWDHDEACQRLKAAGYDRGPYYGAILASRLQELALFAKSSGLEQVRTDLKGGRKTIAEQALLKVHGIGPAVLRNFWVLQGAEDEK